MSSLKKLAGETAIYGASSIIGRFLNYLLVPIFTAVFNPAEFGIVAELYTYAAFLNIIYTFGMETTFFRFANKKDIDDKVIYNNAFTLLLILSLAFSTILALLATPFVNLMDYPGKENYIYLFSAILAIDTIMAVPFARLRLERRPIKFAMAKIANISINIVLVVFFLVFCHKVYEGEFLAGLRPFIVKIYNPDFGVSYVFISNLVASSALFFILWKSVSKVKLKIHIPLLKQMFLYAYPLMIMGLAGVTNDMLSRLMIKYYMPESFYPGLSNQEVLGIFSACYRLSIFMTLGIQAFRFASEPFFFSSAQDKNSPQLFSRVMHWFIIVGCFTMFSISINLDIISMLFLRSEVYWKALDIVPILLLANLFLGIYFNLSIWFKLSDRTHFGSWISISGAVITITLNIILIPILGYMGSAFVTLICYSSMSAISYYFGQKHYPIPYHTIRNLAYIIGTVVLTYAIMAINITNQVMATTFHFGAIVAFLGIVFMLEKKNIKFKTR